MRDAFSKMVFRAAESNDSILVVVADHGHDIFRKVYAELPHKFVNVGIF